MGKKASDITRILSAKFTIGRKVIKLTEKTHRSVLLGLLNILTSHPGNSSAVAARESVAAFLSTADPEKFPTAKIYFTDEVKNVECTGQNLLDLIAAWGMLKTTWNVDRGGKRQVEKEQPASIGEM